MVVTPSFMHLSITFSNQKFSSCSPTIDAGFAKLTSDSFGENSVFKMNSKSCCPLTCDAAVLWFLETILLNVRWSLYGNVDFRPLFLFADVVFPWLVCADITLETVALVTPNIVAVFVTDGPAKRAPTISPLSKSDTSAIFRFFHMDCNSAQ
jgi:hypothetical protein